MQGNEKVRNLERESEAHKREFERLKGAGSSRRNSESGGPAPERLFRDLQNSTPYIP